VRYNTKGGTTQDEVQAADRVLNLIMQVALPEIDRDQYNPKTVGICVNDYACSIASKFVTAAL
jgi:hypothetical protein